MGQQPPPTQGSGRNRRQAADVERSPTKRTLNQGDTAAQTPDSDRETATPRERVPFACQHGNRLLLLEPDPAGWILAELRFDPDACHYVEVRRSQYTSPREAAGTLMSRALAAGGDGAERTARNLDDWLALL